ncbi:MAG: sensor histidine kinase, partial [Myxococcota bacterium]
MERGGPATVERPGWAAYVAVPVLYWLGALLGQRLTMTPEGIALLWPSTAVLLAAYIRFRGRGWAAFSALGVLAEVAADLPGYPLREALVFGVANVIEATVAWRLLAAMGFDARFVRVSDVGRFVLAAPGAAALCGALVGTGMLALVRPLESSVYDAVTVWWFGDAIGLLVVTPLLLAWLVPGPDTPPPAWSRPAVDVGMGIGALLLLGLLAVSDDGMIHGMHLRVPLLFPFVLYAVTRLTFRGVVVLTFALALLFVSLAVAGRGIAPGPERHVATQEHVASLAVLSLGLSALLRCIRLAEEEVRSANARLRHHAEALEVTNLELRRINYVAAHELRTPLRGIGSFSQLLARQVSDRLGPEATGWLHRLRANVVRLDALLGDLAALSAVDEAPARVDTVDLGELVDEVVADLAEPLEAAGAVVTRGSLPTVEVDRAQIAILVKELLSNALHYRSEAPLRVRVSAARERRG